MTAALALTSEQVTAIQQVYAESLPSQERVSEDVIDLTEDIEKRIRDERYDAELLHVTEQLVATQLEQCRLQQRTFERAIQILTADQQHELMRAGGEKVPRRVGPPANGADSLSGVERWLRNDDD